MRGTITGVDLFLILLLLVAVGGVVVVALGKVGGGLAPVTPDVVPPLDERVSRPADLDRARFALALRGYRMDQVDGVLDEARDLLVARDEEIARLRRLVPVGAAVAGTTGPPDAQDTDAQDTDVQAPDVQASDAQDPDVQDPADGDVLAVDGVPVDEDVPDARAGGTTGPATPAEPVPADDDQAARPDAARDPAP